MKRNALHFFRGLLIGMKDPFFFCHQLMSAVLVALGDHRARRGGRERGAGGWLLNPGPDRGLRSESPGEPGGGRAVEAVVAEAGEGLGQPLAAVQGLACREPPWHPRVLCFPNSHALAPFGHVSSAPRSSGAASSHTAVLSSHRWLMVGF